MCHQEAVQKRDARLVSWELVGFIVRIPLYWN